MHLNSNTRKQLALLKAKVNKERKELGLPPMTTPQIIEECVDNIMCQSRVYLANVFVDV